MWWFLIIAFIILAVIWQIPAVGPFLAITLVLAVVAFFWWAMKSGARTARSTSPQDPAALKARTEQAKADSRTHHSTIRVTIDPMKATPENFKRLQQERERHEQVYANRIEAASIAGEIEGQHYTKWAPIIDQLKREGKLAEALSLCLECIDATERQAKIDGHGLPRSYTRNAAIIYRRMKDFEGEVAILERFLAAGGSHPEIKDRLVKARALRDKSRAQ